jgi:hypothetical protein
MHLKHFYLLFLLLLIFSFGIKKVSAQDNSIVVSPQIIDEKVMARDILDRKIKIEYKAETGPKISVYAVVYDFDDKNGSVRYQGPGSADKETSIATWLSLKRAANDMSPGDSIELPLNIKVNMSAVPGKYYAIVYFVAAHDGYEAESASQSGAWPKININLEVLDHTVEKAQITKFISSSNLYLDGLANLTLNVKNIGNSEIIPGGSIHIFDRRGIEIDSLPINTEKKILAASDEGHYFAKWNTAGKIGKFKALADLNYGKDNLKNYQDVIFFWAIPKKYLILFGVGTILLTVLLVILIARRNKMSLQMHKNSAEPEKIINLKT